MKSINNLDRQTQHAGKATRADSFLNVCSAVTYQIDEGDAANPYTLVGAQAIRGFNVKTTEVYHKCMLVVIFAEIADRLLRMGDRHGIDMTRHIQMQDADLDDLPPALQKRVMREGNSRIKKPSGVQAIKLNPGGFGLHHDSHIDLNMIVSKFAEQLDSGYAMFSARPLLKPEFWVPSNVYECSETDIFWDPIKEEEITLSPLKFPSFYLEGKFDDDGLEGNAIDIWLALKKFPIREIYISHQGAFNMSQTPHERVRMGQLEKLGWESSWASIPYDDADHYTAVDYTDHVIVDNRDYSGMVK